MSAASSTAADGTRPKLPNILITGTPGCGKTQHCERLKEDLEFNFINVSQLVKDQSLYESYDEQFDSYIIDEDKTLDALEGPIAQGGVIIDHHSCDFFPERFFQLVVVLRTDNEQLYPRLEGRGYSEKKIEENMEAEIMRVVLDQAEESYPEEVVVVLDSNMPDDIDNNCQRIISWIGAFMEAQAAGADVSEASAAAAAAIAGPAAAAAAEGPESAAGEAES